ncbi:MAG: helix-turn-helix domain-containing protein [Chloroflexota bacterium]
MSVGNAQKPSIDPDSIYSREEAAAALGISLSTLKKLINAGYLRVSQPPGIRRIFIKGESILAMLDETVVERHA